MSAARAQGYPRASAKLKLLCGAFSLCHVRKSSKPNAVLEKDKKKRVKSLPSDTLAEQTCSSYCKAVRV